MGLTVQRSQKQFCANDSGFTFIEVLIALVLLTVGVLGFTKLALTTTATNSYSKKLTSAVTLAEDAMEKLRRQALSSTLTSANDSTETGIGDNGVFDRQTTVTGGLNQLTTLNVVVSWTENGAKSVTLTNLLRQ